jgi:hypothetical protein
MCIGPKDQQTKKTIGARKLIEDISLLHRTFPHIEWIEELSK